MIQSTNPYTQELIATHKPLNDIELNKAIADTALAFHKWKAFIYKERSVLFLKLAESLRNNLDKNPK